MLTFDEGNLLCQLESLPEWGRVAFAAASATRLLPVYREFVAKTRMDDSTQIAAILNFVWRHLAGDKPLQDEIEAHIERAMSMIPKEGKFWTPLYAYAEDAVAAVVYTLRAMLTGKSQEAAWAARRVYEALDHYVVSSTEIDIGIPYGEQKVLAAPLIQTELTRQQRDLADLFQSIAADVFQTIMLIRNRAEKEIALPALPWSNV